MRRLLFIACILLFKQHVFSQDLRIYHGEKSESVFLKQNDGLNSLSRESVKIVRGKDGMVTIAIVNPNPFFYNYEIKTEDVDIVDDYSNQFSELVKLVTSLPDVANHFKGAARAAGANAFNNYQDALTNLHDQIEEVKTAIQNSDIPETVTEAFNRVVGAGGNGFRAAIDAIRKKSAHKADFNSKTLQKDLNDLLDVSIKDGTFNTALRLGAIGSQPVLEGLFKEAFQNLNNSMATIVNRIIEVTKKDKILRFQVPVKENKKTTVKLIVTKVKADDNVDRELLNEEVAVILPYYVRKRFEVVPVMNLIFQPKRLTYYTDNGVIKTAPDDDAKFNVGGMALTNLTSFGEFQEYGIGVGLGYSIQPGGKTNSFFFMPSVSYKDIFRVGIGLGWSMSPVGLKNNVK
ncbi:MAG TPA: hypothetical protein VNR87_11840, partial [Flavisolibacter sp.]|nr:hypothetical protein [Flavisolibacter sp.]